MDNMKFIESFFRSYNLDKNNVQEVKIKNESNCNNDFSPTNFDSEYILDLDEYYDLLNTNNGSSHREETDNDQNVGNPVLEQKSGSFINMDDINNIFEDNFDINRSRINFNAKQELLENTTKDAIDFEYSMNLSDEPSEEYVNVDHLALRHYLEMDQNNFTCNESPLNFVNYLKTSEVESSEETKHLLETKEEIEGAEDIDKFLHDINEIVFNEHNINTDFVDTPYLVSECEASSSHYKDLNAESVQSNDELLYTKVKETKINLGGINGYLTNKADLKFLTPNNQLENNNSFQNNYLNADNVSYRNEFKEYYKNNVNKEIYKNKLNKFENYNWQEYETINIASQNHNKETSIDDNDSDRSGYNSSDFEFISEKEAKEFGIINTKNNTKLKIVGIYNENNSFIDRKYRYLPTIDFSYRDTHKIPEGDDFINLFRGGFEARGCSVLENKKSISRMRVEYEEFGFGGGYFCGNNVENNIIEQINDEANESRNKILEMYPDDNRKRIRLS